MKPLPLLPGDTIGVMAPSSYVERNDIEKSKTILEQRGYKVFVHPQTYERLNQSAGTALQKTLALQGMWQRNDIRAIWCAGGGNRALHFMDSINFNTMKKNPKFLIGFSDVTVLLNGIYAHTGFPGIHGPVFKNLHSYDPAQIDYMLKLMAGEISDYSLSNAKILRHGKAEGKLVGGNLSLFHYLPKTLPGKFWEDSILFLEDCGDELSRFDRMFLHLKRLGVFKDIRGLILGDFSIQKDSGRPYGFSFEEVVLEHLDDCDIPIVTHAPFGHGKELYALPVGGHASLDTTVPSLKLKGENFKK